MSPATIEGHKVPNPYGEAFLDYAKSRSDVVALAGDTAGNNLGAFRSAHPDRFFNIGMAEQNMIGIAGGMARGGCTPFVHTIATFLTRRPFDQIVMAVAYPRLRVRLMGGFSGLNFAGVSHQAIDDVALMRAVPGMTIVDVAEATDIRTMLPTFDNVDGPIYCRIARTELLNVEVPVLFETPFELGVARTLAVGSDIALISASIVTPEALEARRILERLGVGVHHLHISTICPLDTQSIMAAVEKTRATIVIENHLSIGGLGSAVAELMAQHGSDRRLIRLGLQNTYACGGTESYLLSRWRMDAGAIAEAAGEFCDIDPNLMAAELDAAGISSRASPVTADKRSYAII